MLNDEFATKYELEFPSSFQSEISNSSFQSKPSNTQLTLTCSKSTIETLEKEAKYAQS